MLQKTTFIKFGIWIIVPLLAFSACMPFQANPGDGGEDQEASGPNPGEGKCFYFDWKEPTLEGGPVFSGYARKCELDPAWELTAGVKGDLGSGGYIDVSGEFPAKGGEDDLPLVPLVSPEPNIINAAFNMIGTVTDPNCLINQTTPVQLKIQVDYDAMTAHFVLSEMQEDGWAGGCCGDLCTSKDALQPFPVWLVDGFTVPIRIVDQSS